MEETDTQRMPLQVKTDCLAIVETLWRREWIAATGLSDSRGYGGTGWNSSSPNLKGGQKFLVKAS